MISIDKMELLSDLLNSKEGEILLEFLDKQVESKRKELLKENNKDDLYKISIEYHTLNTLYKRILTKKY